MPQNSTVPAERQNVYSRGTMSILHDDSQNSGNEKHQIFKDSIWYQVTKHSVFCIICITFKMAFLVVLVSNCIIWYCWFIFFNSRKETFK